MPPWLKQIGLTPAKAALIAVLGLVMICVWGPQLAQLAGGKKAATARPEMTAQAMRAKPSRLIPSAQLRQPVAPTPGPKPETRSTPELTLADALVHDPFATPTWSPDYLPLSSDEEVLDAPQADEGVLAALLQQGVGMILQSDGENAATIGDRTLRVGDEIDGFRVVEISKKGVVLTPTKGGGRGA